MKFPAFFLFWLFAAACAMGAAEPAELTAAKTRYDAALTAVTTPAFQKYFAELQQLKKQALAAKKAELALAIEEEIKNPGAKPPTEPSLVAALARYDATARVAVKPVREKYAAELQRLKEQALQAGKLEDSVAFKKESDRLFLQDIYGRWQDKHGVMTIKPDGTITHTNGAKGTWEIQDANIVLKWNNHWKHVFPLTKTGETIVGKAITSEGEARPFSGPRVR